VNGTPRRRGSPPSGFDPSCRRRRIRHFRICGGSIWAMPYADRVPRSRPSRWCKSGGHGPSSMLARAARHAAGNAARPGLWIIAELGELFQAHVAGAARCPLVVLLEQHLRDLPQRGRHGCASVSPNSGTTSVRRLISPFNRSSGLVEWSCGQCSLGKARWPSTSSLGLVHEGPTRRTMHGLALGGLQVRGERRQRPYAGVPLSDILAVLHR
jgi:hypothetical protein